MLKKLKNLFDMRDAFIFIGMCLVSYGAKDVYLPASFIAPGLVLLFIGLRRPK